LASSESGGSMEIKASVTYSPVVAKANGKFARYNSKDQKRKISKQTAIEHMKSSFMRNW
jgi:hypothetical protein